MSLAAASNGWDWFTRTCGSPLPVKTGEEFCEGVSHEACRAFLPLPDRSQSQGHLSSTLRLTVGCCSILVRMSNVVTKPELLFSQIQFSESLEINKPGIRPRSVEAQKRPIGGVIGFLSNSWPSRDEFAGHNDRVRVHALSMQFQFEFLFRRCA